MKAHILLEMSDDTITVKLDGTGHQIVSMLRALYDHEPHAKQMVLMAMVEHMEHQEPIPINSINNSTQTIS